MLILFEMEGSKLTSAFYFYSDYLFFIHFVLKDSLPIRAEAFFFLPSTNPEVGCYRVQSTDDAMK